jgi:hypothetical protein
VRKKALHTLTLNGRSIAEELGGENRLLPDPASLGDGFSSCNPSITRIGSNHWVNIRTVDYRLDELGNYYLQNGKWMTKNYLALWDPKSNQLLRQNELKGLPSATLSQGIEDVRLYSRHDQLYGSGSYTPDGSRRQQICRFRIEPETGEISEFSDLKGHCRVEKNWMPLSGSTDSWFLYRAFPPVALEFSWASGSSSLQTRRGDFDFRKGFLSGGSQLLLINGLGWMAVVHEFIYGGPKNPLKKSYFHRFAIFDHELNLRGLSDPWWFHRPGEVEFCAGIAVSEDGSNLFLSYGLNDSSAWICSVPLSNVLGIIKPFDC